MLVLWVVVGMGCNDEAAIVNPSDFKIYVNNVQDVDVFPSEVISIGDHELLIFGICGNSPANKFEGDSSIYLRKIDQTGKTQWDTLPVLSSFIARKYSSSPKRASVTSRNLIGSLLNNL